MISKTTLRRKVLDFAAAYVFMLGALFVFLPDDNRWGPLRLAAILAPAALYLKLRYSAHRARRRAEDEARPRYGVVP